MLGKNRQIDKVNTVIGPGTQIEGKIVSSSSIRIDGELNGEVKADGNVIIGKDGKIKGDLSASMITIEGYVEGNIHASKNLYLASISQLHGDVNANSIEIEQGAIFNGKSAIKHDDKGKGKLKPSKEKIQEEAS